MEDYLIRLYDLKYILANKARFILKDYSRDDIDDIVHNNILKMYEKLKRGLYNPEKAEFSTWAGNVVTNACLDILRNKKVKEKAWTRLKDVGTITYIDHESESTEFINKQLKLIINEYYFSDKTFLEISEEINMNQSTIKVHAFKARTLLKQKIDKFNNKSLEKII